MNPFNAEDRRLMQVLERPLPLTSRPFEAVAREAGMTEEAVLARLRAWLEDGTIRRFGARVSHRAVGYTANGMSVWRVTAEETDRVAAALAACPEVTHCYLRRTAPGWPYNLYAMFHGHKRQAVLATVRRLARATGVQDYQVLFSTRELKKSAPCYFPEREEPA